EANLVQQFVCCGMWLATNFFQCCHALTCGPQTGCPDTRRPIVVVASGGHLNLLFRSALHYATFMSNSKLERLCGFRRSMTQAVYARLLCIADGCNCSAPTCPGCANGRGRGSITDQENSGSLQY